MIRRPSGRHGVLALAVLVGAVLVACGDSEETPGTPAAPSTATSAPAIAATTQATPAQSVEEEVEAAYLAYWAAYSDAVLNLDASLVEGFAVGEELDRVRAEIEGLRADGVAARVVVEHDFLVIFTSGTTATVVDEVVNNSFYVDPTTKDPPVASGAGGVLRNTFFLEKTGGTWVVSRGVRELPR